MVWASLSTDQNWNLHCFTLTRKNTYYDSFCNKCRSDFLTVVMTTKEGVLSMTLLRNVLTWLPSQQKKLRQHSVLLIWLSDLEDFKSLFWRELRTVNKYILNQGETKKKFEEIYFFLSNHWATQSKWSHLTKKLKDKGQTFEDFK